MIKLRYITTIFLCSMGCGIIAPAQHIRKGSSCFKMLQASSQRTVPGMRGADPFTQYSFLIVWRTTKQPGAFFWRGNNTWMTCNIQEAHKPLKKNKITGPQYTLEEIKPGGVKKGDTLLITPIRGGKYAIPSQIPLSAVNTLFFKTTKSNWLKYPVKKIERKPDIIMP